MAAVRTNLDGCGTLPEENACVPCVQAGRV